jgi:hypothetical protein
VKTVKKKSKKYYVYLKKNVLVQIGLSIEEVKDILIDSKVVVNEKKIQ